MSVDFRSLAARADVYCWQIVHNADVARSDPGHGEILSELWMWIGSEAPNFSGLDITHVLSDSKHLLSYEASRIHGFDFANQGVLGIWEGLQPTPRTPSLERDPTIEQPQSHDVEFSLLSLPHDDTDGYRTPGRQRRRRSLRRSHSPADQLHGDFAAAVHTLNIRRGYDRASVAKISAPTSKLAQRRLCLTLCGWNQGDDELLRATTRSVRSRSHDYWAVFMEPPQMGERRTPH